MLLITGTQRCGTSLTADFVRKCGYPMDGDDDAVGKFEDPIITHAYRKLLGEDEFPFSDYPIKSVPDASLESLTMPVAKFAYFMMDPQLLRMWYHRRGSQDRFLILCREAEHVCRSKQNTPMRAKIFSTDSYRFQLTPEQLKQNWFDSFMLVLEFRIPFRCLKFPNYLVHYGELYAALHDFGGLEKIPKDDRLWRDTVDFAKVTAS